MATLAVQEITLAGVDPTLAAAAGGGDDFPNTGREYFDVNNGSGVAINVTFDAVRQCNQGFDHDEVVSVGAGQRRRIGPFPPSRFGPSVAVSYSGVTSLTVAAVRLDN